MLMPYWLRMYVLSKQIRLITKVIVHHSLTADGKVVNYKAILKYHTSWRYKGRILTETKGRKLLAEGKKVTKPWRDIGYHFLIEEIAGSYYVFVGRPLHWEGGHTKGQNETSIGICFVGNYDACKPPKEMLKLGAKRLVVPMITMFGLTTDDIYGHRDFARKSCPGEKFDLDTFKKIVKENK